MVTFSNIGNCFFFLANVVVCFLDSYRENTYNSIMEQSTDENLEGLDGFASNVKP